MPRAIAITFSRLRTRLAAGFAAAVAVSALSAGPALAGDVGPITADPSAVVQFYRTAVGSIAAGHVSPVAVAQADLPRPGPGRLYAPLTSLAPTSGFGYRTSPLTGKVGEFHWGQDFAAACGTPVYAADAGVVRAAGWHPWGGGNRVEIDHGDGIITTYNHMLGAAVKTGETIDVGQVVGLVGSTGSSTGCHLHFETIKDGQHIDPMTFTFIPIAQQGPLGAIQITDYTPKDGQSTNERQNWAVPAVADEPAPGETVTRAPSAPPPPRLADPTPAGPPAAPPTTSKVPAAGTAAPAAPSAAPAPGPAPAPAPSPAPTPTPSPTPTPTPSPAPSPAPTPTPTPAPTPTPTPAPSISATVSAGAATASPSSTSTCTAGPTATATPTPSPSPSPAVTTQPPC